MAIMIATVPGVPICYKFIPTPDVIQHFLNNRVRSEEISINIIMDIEAEDFYNIQPHLLVAERLCNLENEWYFFVHGDEYFKGEIQKEHRIGDGVGFWRSEGEEIEIIGKSDSGKFLLFKARYSYISGSDSHPMEEHQNEFWSLEKYRLPYKCDEESEEQKESWVMGKIIKGKGCDYGAL